jgi:hypothetical protein
MRAVLITAVFMVLAGGVFAAAQQIAKWRTVEEADIGANWVLISVQECIMTTSGGIYPLPIFHIHYPKELFEPFCAEDAKLLRSKLDGLLFTADGEPFDLIAPIPGTDNFWADDRGMALYNADGEYISMIVFNRQYGELTGDYKFFYKAEDDLLRESIIKGEQDYIKLTFDYEEANAFLGVDLRLDAFDVEEYEQVEFNLYDWSKWVSSDGLGSAMTNMEVIAYFGTPSAGMTVKIEPAETGDDASADYFVAYVGVIEQSEFAGVTVTRITGDESLTYYWEINGLIYRVQKSVGRDAMLLTDEDILLIISNMIR